MLHKFFIIYLCMCHSMLFIYLYIAVDQKKIEVMENFPAPTNLKEIRRFQDSPILLLLSLGLQSKILNSFGINIQKKHSKI